MDLLAQQEGSQNLAQQSDQPSQAQRSRRFLSRNALASVASTNPANSLQVAKGREARQVLLLNTRLQISVSDLSSTLSIIDSHPDPFKVKSPFNPPSPSIRSRLFHSPLLCAIRYRVSTFRLSPYAIQSLDAGTSSSPCGGDVVEAPPFASQLGLHLKHGSTLHASRNPASSNPCFNISCFNEALKLEACFKIPCFGEAGNLEAKTLSQGLVASLITIYTVTFHLVS
jgi:hypothetical protein